MKRKRFLNKLYQRKVLLKDQRLRPYMPATRRLTEKSLLQMLWRHEMVYIKPNNGSLGVGVMKVEIISDDDGSETWQYQYKTSVRRFASFGSLYRAIRRETGQRKYLVQQGIRMLRYDKRPFDFRVVIQRTPETNWVMTGIAARLAHPSKIVTNGSQGGTIYAAKEILSVKEGDRAAGRLVKEMERIGLLAAKKLEKEFPKLWEIGLDVAVDGDLRPWILEVNSKPDPCPFKQLKNGNMLRHIISYGRANGKTYALKCKKSRPGRLPGFN